MKLSLHDASVLVVAETSLLRSLPILSVFVVSRFLIALIVLPATPSRLHLPEEQSVILKERTVVKPAPRAKFLSRMRCWASVTSSCCTFNLISVSFSCCIFFCISSFFFENLPVGYQLLSFMRTIAQITTKNQQHMMIHTDLFAVDRYAQASELDLRWACVVFPRQPRSPERFGQEENKQVRSYLSWQQNKNTSFLFFKSVFSCSICVSYCSACACAWVCCTKLCCVSLELSSTVTRLERELRTNSTN